MKKNLNKNLISYILGLIIATFGIVLCVKSDLGLSMIAATPYIFAKYFIRFLPWITQGKAEYIWNLVIIFILAIVVKKWKWSYLGAFVTSFFVGNLIDLWILLLNPIACSSFISRLIFFLVGTVLTSLGIAFFFRTTLPQQAYELFVVELSKTKNLDIINVKKYYDYGTLLLDIVLSLLFFKGFVGVGLGTIFVTLFNSKFIKMFSNILNKIGY